MKYDLIGADGRRIIRNVSLSFAELEKARINAATASLEVDPFVEELEIVESTAEPVAEAAKPGRKAAGK